MEIRKNPEMPKFPRPAAPQEGVGAEANAIVSGGLAPRPNLDRFMFNYRDKDKSGALTSDEYGVGKQKQDEFRRYDRNDDGKVDFKEFKLGRFLDRLKNRKWPDGIDIKPVPMPIPRLPEGQFKPVPMPMPKLPEGQFKPVPMPSPKLDHPVYMAAGQSVSDLVSKVKQAQEGEPKAE